jgi:hypothetical protein
MKPGPVMLCAGGRPFCVALAAVAHHQAAHASVFEPYEFLLVIGLAFAVATALPFAVTAFILRKLRVGLLPSMAMVAAALLTLIIVLTDVTLDLAEVVAFRFAGTLIVLAPLFALAWWLGGFSRRKPPSRHAEQ